MGKGYEVSSRFQNRFLSHHMVILLFSQDLMYNEFSTNSRFLMRFLRAPGRLLLPQLIKTLVTNKPIHHDLQGQILQGLNNHDWDRRLIA